MNKKRHFHLYHSGTISGTMAIGRQKKLLRFSTYSLELLPQLFNFEKFPTIHIMPEILIVSFSIQKGYNVTIHQKSMLKLNMVYLHSLIQSIYREKCFAMVF